MTVFNSKLTLPNLMPAWEQGCRAGRGQGEHADYLPWISIRSFHSQAVRARVPSVTVPGRLIHVMSHGEEKALLLFDFDDEVIDIREQYPLDPHLTLQIAEELNYNHPGYTRGGTVMTSDFLVTYKEGLEKSYRAYQIKHSPAELSARDYEKIAIEREYWRRRGIGFELWFSSQLSEIKCRNIQLLLRCRYQFPAAADSLESLTAAAEAVMSNPLLQELPAGELRLPSGVCTPQGELSLQQTLKLLCAYKVLEFPLEDKLFFECRAADFRRRCRA